MINMVSKLKDILDQEIYNAFGVPLELFKDGSPNKELAEIQLNQFLELNKIIETDEMDMQRDCTNINQCRGCNVCDNFGEKSMSKLVLKEFNGCGLCDLSKEDCDCKKIDVEVEITFKKTQKADNWGTMVTVFNKGEKVKGRAVIKDNIIYCVSAKSNTYEDYEDFVNTENIDIKII